MAKSPHPFPIYGVITSPIPYDPITLSPCPYDPITSPIPHLWRNFTPSSLNMIYNILRYACGMIHLMTETTSYNRKCV